MNALRNILVLMEPGAESQPAFDAAITLAKRYGSSLELLVVVFQDLHPAYFEPMTATPVEFHDSIMAGHRAMLERYVRQAGEEGVGAIGEALWGTPFHEIVLARVAATRPDLVVKYSVFHNRVERTLFTGSDWHLIRDCPVPLLLVKEPARLVGARMLACVDPTHAHDKPAALDVQLLQRGAALAHRLGGELHAAARVLDTGAGRRHRRRIHRIGRHAVGRAIHRPGAQGVLRSRQGQRTSGGSRSFPRRRARAGHRGSGA